ncbi:Bug family tripartite tricarboxylate transporter substrate binding protein [Fictibacillus phosphorivorans]|uniref:Bug family tripartite tricarboxylate transporter substrate binding protein n=1 Tax=Fictibacillus phosphorivorans TaxID=1221500 RepID=UPI0012940A60|nr:tripartite tricarboxylate transporter substrate binding protein [Fictibacillus phosphorivorans]MQR96273.1 tripartite tricarboxylate transporter substrate binding protein [Fictibacillus phosphorivorans]
MKTMKWKKWLVAGVILSSLTACSSSGSGSNAGESDYPKKPITVVAPSGAGGGWDLTARSLSKILGETKMVDQTMTVENKPGGGGAVYLAEYATQHKKDDYKLFISSPPILINNLKKEGNSPYGFKDTTPLAQLTKDFGAIVVKEDSKYNNLKELMDAVKKDPKSVTAAGGSAPGSMDHLVAVLPAYKSDIDPKTVKYVSYDGGGEAIAALLGGNADYIATDASAVGEYLKAGKVKVLGISSTERLKGDLADVPTFKEAGIDADFTIWRGVFGPKEMSDSAVAYWEKTLKKLNESKEWQDELERNGWESEFKNSKEFETFLKDQEKQVEDLLKSLGMNK